MQRFLGYFGNLEKQAYERRSGEICSIYGKGQTLKGRKPKRVSALRLE
jgi:hypothetical protein